MEVGMKKNIMTYKKYIGEFEFDADARIFHGRIANINDVVSFYGRSVDELETALREAVEDYLETCAQIGDEPEKPYSGRFNIRLSLETHRGAVQAAKLTGKSLNGWVAEEIEKSVKEIFPN